MEIVAYPSEPLADKIESILRRRVGVSDEVDEAVRQVLHQVRARGDLEDQSAALLASTKTLANQAKPA